ncbi:MAG: hypothetical protein NXY57DRAFT_1043887 [Lentinula lateritia]|nr:MAG: hypothetical protein NXY57DRAFT_1043887 [Lentinula lateritia]
MLQSIFEATETALQNHINEAKTYGANLQTLRSDFEAVLEQRDQAYAVLRQQCLLLTEEVQKKDSVLEAACAKLRVEKITLQIEVAEQAAQEIQRKDEALIAVREKMEELCTEKAAIQSACQLEESALQAQIEKNAQIENEQSVQYLEHSRDAIELELQSQEKEVRNLRQTLQSKEADFAIEKRKFEVIVNASVTTSAVANNGWDLQREI